MILDEKIELFFFEPSKTRDEYIEFYKSINPERTKKENGRYRYSPLYLLLKDIRYCFGYGREFNPIRGNLNPAEFAGIVILRIAFTNTVKRIYSGRFEQFAKQYMSIIDSQNLEAISLLRNALEHSYYSLYTYVDRKIQSSYVRTKVYFSLGSYDEIIQKSDKWKRPYPSEMYLVNPRRLFTAFEKGIMALKDDLKKQSNSKLRNNFERNFSLDDWVTVG